MKESELKLNGGALIIGSLLWQDHLNDVGDTIRKIWRNDFLDLSQKIMVKVPIRYGRLSQKSKIYTMVFSNAVRRKMGTAFFVPFKNLSLTLDEIITHAREMSYAEGMNRKFVAGKEIWCVMGILFNPRVETRTKDFILKKWEASLDKGFDTSDFKINNERCCIEKTGELNIPWPKPVDERNAIKLDQFDFIIATATKPTDYPSISELATSIKKDQDRYYFIENVINGISTFQDNQVLNNL